MKSSVGRKTQKKLEILIFCPDLKILPFKIEVHARRSDKNFHTIEIAKYDDERMDELFGFGAKVTDAHVLSDKQNYSKIDFVSFFFVNLFHYRFGNGINGVFLSMTMDF